jgi:S-phase kinase-associated protein 1
MSDLENKYESKYTNNQDNQDNQVNQNNQVDQDDIPFSQLPTQPLSQIDSLDPDESNQAMVTLISKEGAIFNIPRSISYQSILIKTSLEKDHSSTEINLPDVSSPILSKICDFMTHHAKEPMSVIEKPLKSAEMKDLVSKFYAEFCNQERDTLFKMILAANYMDIKPMFDLCCAKVGSIIKGHTPKEIQKKFEIPDDAFTEEELKELNAEEEWMKEEN